MKCLGEAVCGCLADSAIQSRMMLYIGERPTCAIVIRTTFLRWMSAFIAGGIGALIDEDSTRQ